ncbi:hypothetical protein [Aquisediminimonas sediminicola]|nr:hypothetical protein [Aquisediminimonas sediminicola]
MIVILGELEISALSRIIECAFERLGISLLIEGEEVETPVSINPTV